jgi:hypothetical protein
MKFQTILRSNYGKLVISVILGFGLSTLFRKSCKDKECLKFEGPSPDKLKNQTYKYEKLDSNDSSSKLYGQSE